MLKNCSKRKNIFQIDQFEKLVLGHKKNADAHATLTKVVQ